MATFASSILKDTTVFCFIESFWDSEMTVHVISHLNYIADGYSDDLPTSLLSSQELIASQYSVRAHASKVVTLFRT